MLFNIDGLYPLDASSTLSPSRDNHKCPQTLPNIPWRAKSPPVENCCRRSCIWLEGPAFDWKGPPEECLDGAVFQSLVLFGLPSITWVCFFKPPQGQSVPGVSLSGGCEDETVVGLRGSVSNASLEGLLQELRCRQCGFCCRGAHIPAMGG